MLKNLSILFSLSERFNIYLIIIWYGKFDMNDFLMGCEHAKAVNAWNRAKRT